ncbi:MAG: hypothetical protein KGJ60_00590 [Verrucomicrobiota bacterium]|nr:hypothetical protein [Verrucomicrobiota bacterium]
MKLVPNLICAGCLLAGMASAQSPVTLTIDTRSPGRAIPADFTGLSFGAVAELPNHGGAAGCLFSPTNTQLVTLFKNSGIHHLRLGGSTVDGLKAALPGRADIDSVFAFAKAADIKVLYSLRLLNGSAAEDAATAGYIWNHYRPWLDGFAIGNEPDIRRYHYPPFGTGSDASITNYSSWLAAWRKFAAAVGKAAPDAKFAAPDAAGRTWAARFARDKKNSALVAVVTQHYYVGGSPFIEGSREKIPAQEAIDKMLSPDWVARKYPSFYGQVLRPALADGLPCRLTESNDYLKGVPDASDAFASALWALDYLWWWAAHGVAGVNFHNTEWLTTDTVYLDASGNYRINPKAYAIKAFDLGAHGRVAPVSIINANGLNLTAYAAGDAANLYVTIINKEHGAGARAAAVAIVPKDISSGNVAVMFLSAPDGNVGATSGITLGGVPIANHVPWRGRWTMLHPVRNGACAVTVPAASAVVVKISTR